MSRTFSSTTAIVFVLLPGMKELGDSAMTNVLEELDFSPNVEGSSISVSATLAAATNSLNGDFLGDANKHAVGFVLLLVAPWACQNHRGKPSSSEYTNRIIGFRDFLWPVFWCFHPIFMRSMVSCVGLFVGCASLDSSLFDLVGFVRAEKLTKMASTLQFERMINSTIIFLRKLGTKFYVKKDRNALIMCKTRPTLITDSQLARWTTFVSVIHIPTVFLCSPPVLVRDFFLNFSRMVPIANLTVRGMNRLPTFCL